MGSRGVWLGRRGQWGQWLRVERYYGVESGTNPYRVLGVARDAALPEIQRAYLRMAKRYHPDVAPAKEREAATARFQNLAAAMRAILAQRAAGVGKEAASIPKDLREVLTGYDAAFIFDFVRDNHDPSLQAELHEVGQTMQPAGPDRTGLFFMAQMMQVCDFVLCCAAPEKEKGSKEASVRVYMPFPFTPDLERHGQAPQASSPPSDSTLSKPEAPVLEIQQGKDDAQS
ncbi:uncharacterized protein MONBRDRAFT_10992 [Monosiga brevicollis MX1]|uniref:J domain-containing protein n=1 Tax=Monosiga brevicollis TaxID=81824 RepID=A9V7V9_MONBE|nr:uncharacterized protein MONBRDRAFT_10992 [Monosiga brevicollis MX1]EDQ86444.1 predicted protein [Monosiga brevicollis MX1]|eukprot:XP_001748834.1 hypothetical protein [Monosiga brevicollis MX1]